MKGRVISLYLDFIIMKKEIHKLMHSQRDKLEKKGRFDDLEMKSESNIFFVVNR